MRRSPLWLLLSSLLFTGCVPSTGQIERGLEAELPKLLGPADRYDVEIEGLRARSGEASRVTAVGERVRLREAPVVDRLDVELLGVKYDRGEDRLERVERASATARITPLDLADFLEAHRNVREAAVTFAAPNRATIRLRPEVGGIALPRGVTVEVTGRLEPAGRRLHVEVTDVSAAGVSLGRAAASGLADLVNPLVDLSDSPADLRVTDVRVEDGVLRLDATGNPTGLRLRQPGW
jgi:hypothetical protein